jgi:hypothetical protein
VAEHLWILITGCLLVLLIVISTKKGWVSWRGGRGIATLTAFHDFQPRDKQEAIEVMIERKAGKQWESQKSGKGTGGGSPEGNVASPEHK